MDGFEMSLRRSVLDPVRNPTVYLVGRPFGRVVKGAGKSADAISDVGTSLNETIHNLTAILDKVPVEIRLAIEAESDRLKRAVKSLTEAAR
jgi:hypothetical protein